MSTIFLSSFEAMFLAMLKIFMIALLAGFLVRKKIFKEEYIKGLSVLVVNVLLPAMVMSNILSNLKPNEQPNWWLIPILGVFTTLITTAIASLFYLRNLKVKKNLISISAMQNAGYLVLPIGQIVFPEQFSQFALYTFLFILGFNPVLWSLGKYLCTSDGQDYKFKLSLLITPPLIANIIAVSLVLLHVNKYIPSVIYDPINLIGTATVPIATFILGATLGSISFKIIPTFWDIFRVLFIKLFLIPALTILILFFLELKDSNPMLCSFFVIQAGVAPAANIMVMINNYGGDIQKIGSLMLISYIVSMITMPFWIAFWNIIQ